MTKIEPVNVGILSILPPIVAITLALITKEVFISLLIGILTGTLLYTNGHVLQAVTSMFDLMVQKMGENGYILIFLALLGALVAVITMAGGSHAYGTWAAKKIKTRAGAMLSTSLLGAVIFIDDYFNCLTVGTVMKPLTDQHKISRAKLAYLIDATAAPVCIIAPISSWAAAVSSQIGEIGGNGMSAFLHSIPYNLYAILTIVMVLLLCLTQRDFGPMAKQERRAQESGIPYDYTEHKNAEGELSNLSIKKDGRIYDLVIPIASLIIGSIAAMLYFGGFGRVGEDGTRISVGQAFGATDAAKALTLGGFFALLIAFCLFVCKRSLSLKEFFDGVLTGFKSMIGAMIVLILAWSLSGVCRDLLQTGTYVGNLVASSNLPLWLLPAIIFLVSGILAFATGTSWGTFGILIPIVLDIVARTDSTLLFAVIGATLAGAVYGDHCSPISDTTILSATGAGCHLLTHVTTQAPYATIVAIICCAGYLVYGISGSIGITWIAGLILLAGSFFVIFRPNPKSAKR